MYSYKINYRTILGDLHTPVSTYLKLRDAFSQSVLMESSDYHGSENNRSFIAIGPMASVQVSHGKATLTFPDHTSCQREIGADYKVDAAINEFLSQFSVKGDYLRYCGLYGYTTFNATRYFESIPVKDSLV